MNARQIVLLVAAAAALWLLSPGAIVPVLPSFDLDLGFNEGATFGMLSGVMAGKPLLKAALTGAVTLILAVMAFRARRPFERAGLALVAGGALDNIVDRLRQGAVTDFVDLYWRGYCHHRRRVPHLRSRPSASPLQGVSS